MSTELVPSTSRSLYAVADDLSCYFDTLEGVDAQLESSLPDDERLALERDRDEIRTKLDCLGKELGTKTDSVAGVLRRIAVEQELVKAEEVRLHARRKSFERAEDWLRKYVLSVMRQNGIDKLKSPTNTLYIGRSDGVIITDADAIPSSYQNAEIKLPMDLWDALVSIGNQYGDATVMETVYKLSRVTEIPRLADIKKAIKGGADVAGANLEMREHLVLR